MMSSTMHHQRIHDVFAGNVPDRFPICEQAFASSVASEIFGKPMLTGSTELHFQESQAWWQGEQAHQEFVEKLYQDVIELHRFFDFDILYLPWRMESKPSRKIDDHTFLYGDPEQKDWWQIRSFDPVSKTYGELDGTFYSYEDVLTVMRQAIDDYEKHGCHSATVSPEMRSIIGQYGDEFVIAGSGCLVVPMDAAYLEATVMDEGLVNAWLDVKTEQQLSQLAAQHEAGIFFINGGGDFAFNSGPIYSPGFFDRVMAPHWKRIFDKCRQMGMYYVMRSDGNLWPVADTLFGNCRPHAYYEVDFDAGMVFSEIRKRFPELVLIGNVSCELLVNGTADDVKREIETCCRGAEPRFIGASANSILHGTPVENVFALFDTVKEIKPTNKK